MRRAFVLLLALAACTKGLKRHPPDAATTGASAVTTVSSAAPPETAPPPPPPPASAAPVVADSDRVALEQAKQHLADVESMVVRGVFTDPQKPEDGDAKMKCGNLESLRPRLEAMPTDPEIQRLLEREKRACGFDVPLLAAKAALDQERYSSSQASRLLTCTVASREIAKARSTKIDDKRLREVDARYRRTCFK
ncbi:MAG: hypothetical protein KF819_12195 [Labilithrix sp.]|nr:hypothetical protein [Labilithrix sp.]